MTRSYRQGALFGLIALLLTANPSVVCAVDNGPLPPYELGKKPFWLIVRHDNTPMYAAPSEGAKIVHRWEKGRYFSNRQILAPQTIDPLGENSAQWIQLKGLEWTYPSGWVRRRDFLSPAEFKRVERWPIKTFFLQFGDAYKMYRFEPDGTAYAFESPAPELGVQPNGYVMVAEGIVYIGGTPTGYDGPLDMFYHEEQGLMCPGGRKDCKAFLATPAGQYWRQTQFTQEEMDTFFKAKAEGRPPPKIRYNDGLPE
jgi:hypothetical protein